MDLNLRLLIKAIADVSPVKKFTEATDAIAQSLKEVTSAAKGAGQDVAAGLKEMLGGAAGGQVSAGADIAESLGEAADAASEASAAIGGGMAAVTDDLGKATGAAREASVAIGADMKAIGDAAEATGAKFVKVTAEEIRAMGGWEAFEKAVKNGALDAAAAVAEETQALEKETRAADESAEANNRNAESAERMGRGAHRSKGLIEDLAETMGQAVKYSLAYGAVFKAIQLAGNIVSLPFTVPVKLFEGAVALGKESTELVNAARTFGVSLSDWQKLQYAFAENHLEPKLMSQSLERLNRAVVASARHGKDQAVAFKVIGVSVLDAHHKLKPMAEILGDVADGYSHLTNATKRDYVAQLLFGRSAQELDPILRNGSKGLKAYGDEAERLGLVLSDDKLLSGKQLDKDWRDFTETVGGLRRELLGDLLPMFTDLTEQATAFVELHRPEIVKDITDFARELKAHLPELTVALDHVMKAGLNLLEHVDWEGLANVIVKVANAIAYLFGKDKQGGTRAFDWIGSAWQGLVTALPLVDAIDGILFRPGPKANAGAAGRGSAVTAIPSASPLGPGWPALDYSRLGLAPALPAFGAPMATGGFSGPAFSPAARDQADRREPLKGQIDVHIQDDRTTIGRVYSSNPDFELNASRGWTTPGW